MRRAVSLWEVLLITAVTAILVAALLPVFHRARETDHPPPCRAHLKQVGMALRMYLQDYDDRLPPHGYVLGTQCYTLPMLLDPYLKNSQVWQCPIAKHEQRNREALAGGPSAVIDYGYNWSALELYGVGRKADTVQQPGATVAFTDSTSYLAAPGASVAVLGGTPPAYRHTQPHPATATVAWLDGHVGAMPAAELEETQGVEDGQQLGSGIDVYRYWNRR